MLKERPVKTDSQKALEGASLSVTFLVVSAFLLLAPDYFANNIISQIVGFALAFFGLIGLGIELNNLSNKRPLGLDNLGIGLGFFIIWGLLLRVPPNPFLRLLFIAPLLFAVYGTILGILMLIKNSIPDEKTPKEKIVVKIPLAVTQIAGFILTLLQIYRIIIKDFLP